MTLADLPSPPIGLAVALGAGLLIGIERERRKGVGERRQAAGLRSFAVAAVTGGLTQWLPVDGLVLVGALLVASLAAMSHFKSRSDDPGMTTELALFATFLIGVQAMIAPALAAACAAGLATLLAMRERLHRFATRWLTDQELHDGLLLLALALIVLPLVPDRPLGWMVGMSPRPLVMLVLLIMAMQAAGQVALRWLGPRGGALAAGFLSGFVSSTAAVASLGSRARADPGQTPVLAAAAGLSTAATWLQAMVVCAAVSPGAITAVGPMVLAGALGAAVVGVRGLWAAPLAPGTRPAEGATPAPRSALRPREALAVALTLGVVAVVVGQAQQHHGDAGRTLGTALAATLDAHAPVAALASLNSAGTLSTSALMAGILVAIGTNSLTRCVVALMAGGLAYALRVGLALAVGLSAALGVSLIG